MGVLGYIARDSLVRFEVGGKFLDRKLLAIALVSENDFCALADEGVGDGVGQAPAVRDAKDEGSLAREEVRHELLIVARGGWQPLTLFR